MVENYQIVEEKDLNQVTQSALIENHLLFSLQNQIEYMNFHQMITALDLFGLKISNSQENEVVQITDYSKIAKFSRPLLMQTLELVCSKFKEHSMLQIASNIQSKLKELFLIHDTYKGEQISSKTLQCDEEVKNNQNISQQLLNGENKEQKEWRKSHMLSKRKLFTDGQVQQQNQTLSENLERQIQKLNPQQQELQLHQQEVFYLDDIFENSSSQQQYLQHTNTENEEVTPADQIFQSSSSKMRYHENNLLFENEKSLNFSSNQKSHSTFLISNQKINNIISSMPLNQQIVPHLSNVYSNYNSEQKIPQIKQIQGISPIECYLQPQLVPSNTFIQPNKQDADKITQTFKYVEMKPAETQEEIQQLHEPLQQEQLVLQPNQQLPELNPLEQEVIDNDDGMNIREIQRREHISGESGYDRETVLKSEKHQSQGSTITLPTTDNMNNVSDNNNEQTILKQQKNKYAGSSMTRKQGRHSNNIEVQVSPFIPIPLHQLQANDNPFSHNTNVHQRNEIHQLQRQQQQAQCYQQQRQYRHRFHSYDNIQAHNHDCSRSYNIDINNAIFFKLKQDKEKQRYQDYLDTFQFERQKKIDQLHSTCSNRHKSEKQVNQQQYTLIGQESNQRVQQLNNQPAQYKQFKQKLDEVKNKLGRMLGQLNTEQKALLILAFLTILLKLIA